MATASLNRADFEGAPLAGPSNWNYANVLRTVASIVPGRPAISCSGRRITYAEFDARTDQLAMALQRRGIRAGSKVAIDLLNAPEYLEIGRRAGLTRKRPKRNHGGLR